MLGQPSFEQPETLDRAFSDPLLRPSDRRDIAKRGSAPQVHNNFCTIPHRAKADAMIFIIAIRVLCGVVRNAYAQVASQHEVFKRLAVSPGLQA